MNYLETIIKNNKKLIIKLETEIEKFKQSKEYIDNKYIAINQDKSLTKFLNNSMSVDSVILLDNDDVRENILVNFKQKKYMVEMRFNTIGAFSSISFYNHDNSLSINLDKHNLSIKTLIDTNNKETINYNIVDFSDGSNYVKNYLLGSTPHKHKLREHYMRNTNLDYPKKLEKTIKELNSMLFNIKKYPDFESLFLNSFLIKKENADLDLLKVVTDINLKNVKKLVTFDIYKKITNEKGLDIKNIQKTKQK